MTTLKFGKDVDDIEEPEALQEGWYKAQVTVDPVIAPNKKKQAGATYEDGAGDNLIVKVKLVAPNDPGDGRIFTIWLPFPSEEDESAYDGIGMLKYDAKMQKIAGFANAASGCSIDGDEITILPNAAVGVYVSIGLDQQGDKMINSIEHFKQGFIPADQVGSFDDEEDGEELDLTDAPIPFD